MFDDQVKSKSTMSLSRKSSKAGSKTGLARKASKLGKKSSKAQVAPVKSPAASADHDEHDDGNVVVQDFHVEVSGVRGHVHIEVQRGLSTRTVRRAFQFGICVREVHACPKYLYRTSLCTCI